MATPKQPASKKATARRKVGRPPKLLDDTVQQRLVAALRAGAYMDAAAAHAGIGLSTLMLWNARGRDERERITNGETPDPKEAPYLEILEAVEKARADAEVRNITIIQNAAQNGQWQAAAWWLERTAPKKYARRTEVVTPEGESLNVHVTVDDLEAKITRLLGEGE